MGTATEPTDLMAQASNPTLAALTAESFRPYVNTIFEFRGIAADGSVASSGAELELMEVNTPSDGSRNRDPRWRQPFSLLFVMRGGSLSANGLCRMTHNAFATSDLFLSRVDVRSRPFTQPYYEAVFG